MPVLPVIPPEHFKQLPTANMKNALEEARCAEYCIYIYMYIHVYGSCFSLDLGCRVVALSKLSFLAFGLHGGNLQVIGPASIDLVYLARYGSFPRLGVPLWGSP